MYLFAPLDTLFQISCHLRHKPSRCPSIQICPSTVSFILMMLDELKINLIKVTFEFKVSRFPRSFFNPLRNSFLLTLSGSVLARTILLGPVQGHVAHALYRLRPIPAAEPNGHVADYAVHDQRCDLLRPISGTCDQFDSEFGLFTTSVSREGKCEFCKTKAKATKRAASGELQMRILHYL